MYNQNQNQNQNYYGNQQYPNQNQGYNQQQNMYQQQIYPNDSLNIQMHDNTNNNFNNFGNNNHNQNPISHQQQPHVPNNPLYMNNVNHNNGNNRKQKNNIYNNNNNNNNNYNGIEDYQPYKGPMNKFYNKIVDPPTGIFKEKDIRVKFISKVLKIIASQFLLTTLFCLASVFSEDYRDFLAENYYLLVLTSIVSLGCAITLYCCRSCAKKVPNNYILLFVFTLCESYSLSYICAFTEPGTVLLAAGITCLLVICLTVYAIKTKRDITQKANIIFYAFIAVFVLSIGAIFFQSKMINIVVAVGFLLVFSAFLVLDIQRLQGNRKFGYDIDDYILAALDIYIDIIVIFQQLLYLLNN